MIASSGRCGVDSSLKISIVPSRMTTKSVNVPPVSTPILKVDSRDILDMSLKDRFKRLNRALRIAFPRERLNVRHNSIEVMDRNFASPCKVRFGRGAARYRFDPVQNLRPLFIIRADVQRRALIRIDTNLRVRPPACFDQLKIKERFENE